MSDVDMGYQSARMLAIDSSPLQYLSVAVPQWQGVNVPLVVFKVGSYQCSVRYKVVLAIQWNVSLTHEWTPCWLYAGA